MYDIQNQDLPLWAQILVHQPPAPPAPTPGDPAPSNDGDEKVPAA